MGRCGVWGRVSRQCERYEKCGMRGRVDSCKGCCERQSASLGQPREGVPPLCRRHLLITSRCGGEGVDRCEGQNVEHGSVKSVNAWVIETGPKAASRTLPLLGSGNVSTRLSASSATAVAAHCH